LSRTFYHLKGSDWLDYGGRLHVGPEQLPYRLEPGAGMSWVVDRRGVGHQMMEARLWKTGDKAYVIRMAIIRAALGNGKSVISQEFTIVSPEIE
jgi:hypothetical protein